MHYRLITHSLLPLNTLSRLLDTVLVLQLKLLVQFDLYLTGSLFAFLIQLCLVTE